MRAVLAVIVALAACSGSGSGSGKSCDAEVDDLMAFLNAMDHTPPLVQLDDKVRLVERSDGKGGPPPPMPVVVLAPGKTQLVAFYGEPHDVDDLEVALTRAMANVPAMSAKDSARRDPRVIALAVDRTVPWSRVQGALDTMRLVGATAALLVFETTSPVAAPPRVAFDDELDKLLSGDSANRASELAKRVGELTKDCAPLAKSYAAVGGEEDDRASVIIAATGEGLRACSCRADLPALRSTLWRIAGNAHPQRYVVAALATPPTIPFDTPWAEASKSFH